MWSPTLYYLRNRSVEERMIYRFLVSDLCGITACLCFCASYLTGRMTSIALADESGVLRSRLTSWLFQTRWFWTVPIGFYIVGGLLVVSSLFDRLTTGMTYEHWSRYVVMSFCFAVAIILSVTRVIDYAVSYTHLDVYKRQAVRSGSRGRTRALPDLRRGLVVQLRLTAVGGRSSAALICSWRRCRIHMRALPVQENQ